MAADVEFRAFRPEDAPGVIETLREYYGDDYYHVHCYDSDYLVKASQDGRRMICVADSPTDGVVGVVDGSYRSYFPGSYELGLHVLRRAYQGRGLGRALLSYCVERMQRMKIYGVYGMAVTFHDHSQRECEAIDLPATGFWLGRYRADRAFFAEKPRSPKLHSLVVAKAGCVRNEGPLYAPARHRAFIADVYRRLETPFDFAEDETCAATVSSIYVKDVEDAHSREIYVRSVGSDLCDRVRELTRDATPESSYTLFLNLLDRGCGSACERLKEQGFYFSGLHPLHDHCEFILLHRECAGGYAWDELRLTPQNQRMLDYILKARED